MIEEELFKKIADLNFHVFDITSIKDIETIYKLYPRKEMIRDLMKNKILSKNNKIELPEKITIEIYLLLSEFCVLNKIEPLEACAIFKIISDICILIRKKRNKQEIYENFKKFMLTFAMNRFSMQIGILKKDLDAKILRQYFESHRPKTELEQKIEMVLEFEREKLDKKMEKIFKEQDDDFNAKIEELFKKKK